ncbi:hypothetical protein AGMMS49545_24110 [Betaproteobacteria bacterium]|nr:hypothetical protein AGMMS49545_24110 [Betaproteobacteria bacterium]GHU49659.1 hypothetical protein AGMMS50289_26630 [Betaproteobacteria bacterium]
MQAKFKYVLGFVVGLLFTIAAMASEPVPIEDKDAFEKQYIDCIESGAKNDCLVSIFSNHFDPQFKNPGEIVDGFNKYYQEKMTLPPVYRVHVIEKTIKAEVFDNRSYLPRSTHKCIKAMLLTCVKRGRGSYQGGTNHSSFSEARG